MSTNRLLRRGDFSAHSGSSQETLVVKDAKVNFDLQLAKLEKAISSADNYNFYGVYPAIDVCGALSKLLHSRVSGETMSHAVTVSETFIHSMVMANMTQVEREMTEEELNALPAIEQEWDV